MEADFENEAIAFFHKWLEDTVQVLKSEVDRLGVKDTEELHGSLRYLVLQVSQGHLGAEIHFLSRGRYVDMGAGRRAKVETLGRRKALKGRQPVRWYSPAFYARLNDLRGVLGIKLMEQAIQVVKQEFANLSLIA